MKIYKSTILFILIVFLSAFIRLYDLARLPNSVSADEAAFGYNAYSILKTGRDEFGHRLPLYLQSFDDNKNPVFAYIEIPFIWLWGLSDMVIRLPSALSGIGVVILTYIVARQLTGNTKLSLTTSLFAAICPWLIQYSRVAIEMELALFFTLLAFWFFLKALTSPRLIFVSTILGAISFYTYHSSKLFTLAFGFVLLTLYFKYLRKRYLIAVVILFGIFLVPYAILLNRAQLGLRPYAVSVFSNEEDYFANTRILAKDQELTVMDGKIIHNRRFIPANQAIQGYLSVLSPSILFGQNKGNHAPNTRLIYVWMLPLLIGGMYALTRNPQLFVLILSWIFLGFLPGGLSKFPPVDRRILLSSFPLLLLSSYGYTSILRLQTKNRLFSYLTKSFLVIIPAVSVYFYLHYYFVHGRIEVIDTWGNGAHEMVEKVYDKKADFEKVIVSLKANQPLTFFLYYEKYPPEKYLSTGGTVSGGYLDERNKYDKFQFKFIGPEDLSPQTLYVWKTDEIQPCLEPQTTIKQTNGEDLVHIGIYNPNLKNCPLAEELYSL